LWQKNSAQESKLDGTEIKRLSINPVITETIQEVMGGETKKNYSKEN